MDELKTSDAAAAGESLVATTRSGQPDPVEPALLDADALADLRNEDNQLLRDLIDLFFSETSRSLRALVIALSERDQPQVERLAHTLKSSAATLGASSMSQTAAAVELAAHAGDFAEILRLLDALQREAACACAAPSAERARLGSGQSEA
jgi:HPt (histidine-containing phosphotransfer) domain-containing protein